MHLNIPKRSFISLALSKHVPKFGFYDKYSFGRRRFVFGTSGTVGIVGGVAKWWDWGVLEEMGNIILI